MSIRGGGNGSGNRTSLPCVIELIRVSTDGQHDRGTPEIQRRALDELREGRPGRVVARIDPPGGVSGALPVDQRPDVIELRRLIAAHGMDELRVYDLDRLSRAERIEDRLAILGIVADAGAIIVDATGREVDPTDDMGELTVYLRTLFARQERRRILARTRGGKHRRAAEGGLVGHGPGYGYHYDKKSGALSIDEREATVVRRIYRSVAAEETPVQVARDLNAEGVATPAGGRWTPQRVRQIVSRSSYRGVHVQRVEGRAYEMAVPRIVDDEMWHAAVAAIRSRRRAGRVPRGTVRALCRRRARCTCGAAMWIRPGDGRRQGYYYCRSRRDGRPCGAGYHPLSAVDEAVWRVVRDVIEQPALLAEASAAREDTREQWEAQIAQCERVIERARREERRVLDLLRDELLSEDGARERLREVRTQRQTAERSRETAQRALETADRGAAALDGSLERWRGLLDDADWETRQQLVEAVIPALPGYGVTIHPDEIEVVGALPISTEESGGGSVVMGEALSTGRHCPQPKARQHQSTNNRHFLLDNIRHGTWSAWTRHPPCRGAAGEERG